MSDNAVELCDAALAEASWCAKPIPVLFDAVAARTPDKVAVVSGALSLTYAELRRGSQALAAAILRGGTAGPIGVLVEDEGWFAMAALACLRAGRPVVPLDARHPDARHAGIASEAGLSLVICDSAAALRPPPAALPRIVVLEDSPTAISVCAEPLKNGPAFILYTSGSTGRPKGICNGQAAVLKRVFHYSASCGVARDDRFLVLTSSSSIAGLRDIFTALLNGATLVVAQPARIGLNGVLTVMAREAVTAVYLVPSLLRALLRVDGTRDPFRTLRIVRLGGEPVWESDVVLSRARIPDACRILVAYSSTEVPTVLQFLVPPGWSGNGGKVPVGRPQPGAVLQLLDETGRPAPRGGIGELVVRSPYLALGLWQEGRLQPGLVEAAGPEDDGVAMIRTGDLMRVADDGMYVPVGRVGRQIKLRGHRVDPGELEAVLRAASDVAEAAVIVREEAGEAVGLDAFVVPRDSEAPPSIGSLKSAAAVRLPPYMQPAHIHVIERLPLLAGFKLDLAALTRMAEEKAECARALTPEDKQAQGLVAEVWTDALGRRSVESDAPWGEAGGNSLKALNLVLALEKASGMRVPFDVLGDTTRPSDLAKALVRLNAQEQRGEERARLPLIVFAPGIGGDNPALARLRAHLGAGFRFLVLRYPDARSTIAARASFEAIIRHAAVQLRGAAKPDDEVHLLGYSFGGFVAWRLAELMIAEERKLGLLGMIDSFRSSQLPTETFPMSTWLRQAARSPVAALGNAAWSAIYGLLMNAPVQALRPVPALVDWLPFRGEVPLTILLEKRLQSRALRAYVPGPLSRPAVLFRSSDFSTETSDYGWGHLTPDLAIELVGGTHKSILDPPWCAQLAARIAAAVADTGRAAPATMQEAS